MASDSVTVRIDGDLTISGLGDAFARFGQVLEALEQDQAARVRWLLAGLEYGSAGITARAEPVDDASAIRIPAMINRYLWAAQQVATGAPHTEDRLLRSIRDLVSLADNRHRVILETATDEVIFGDQAIPISLADPPSTTKSLGTIRGRVETLSHRKGLRFTLYELATDRPVSCYLEDEHETQMRSAWGHVADVTGVVTRDTATGRPMAVRHITDVSVVAEGDTLGFLRARGVVGGTEPAEVVIRRIRDAS